MIKPMLACEVPLDKLKYPLLASPKIDGIRCIIRNGIAYSRSLKPIRNRYIQSILGNGVYNGLDGELTVGDTFQDCGSIMAFDGEPDFVFWVFDCFEHPHLPFTARYNKMKGEYNLPKQGIFLDSIVVKNEEEILSFESMVLKSGYEGIILRSPDSPYKYGRSTPREQYLIKRKPFVDDEAIIVGFEEQYENTNNAELNELGYTKRSSVRENLVGKQTLGLFNVCNNRFGSFNVGTGKGLTQELRQHIWDNRDQYNGKTIKFKYQAYGVKDKPRLPIFLGFRDEDDL